MYFLDRRPPRPVTDALRATVLKTGRNRMTTARGLTRRVSLGLLGALATPWLARAQSDYPSRIVKLIVPYAAGGSSDVVARFIAECMRDRLGQSIVIDNRP